MGLMTGPTSYVLNMRKASRSICNQTHGPHMWPAMLGWHWLYAVQNTKGFAVCFATLVIQSHMVIAPQNGMNRLKMGNKYLRICQEL